MAYITYSYTNSIVSGATEAAVGDTVVVSAIPDTGYGITNTLTQIIITNNDIAIPYTWDSSTNQITFTITEDGSSLNIIPNINNPTADLIRENGLYAGRSTTNGNPLFVAVSRSDTSKVYALIAQRGSGKSLLYVSESISGRYYYVYSLSPSTTINGNYVYNPSGYTKDDKTIYYNTVAIANDGANPDIDLIDGLSGEEVWNAFFNRTTNIVVQFNPVLLDPNAQGGTSGVGGGDGTFDDTSNPIPFPSLPYISTVDTGLVTLFRPTQQQVLALGNYLWTNIQDFWENLQKLFTNPMDYFIAFNIFPVNPTVGSDRDIYIGNWKTEIEMPPVLSQWYDFNCGTVTIPKYWGSALDFAPNTKIQLMLPFIGSVSLNTDEVMGQQLQLSYRIDLLSGSCVAMLAVNGSVYYQWTGECAVSIPLTGADWSRIYSAVMGAVGTAVAGGIGAAAVGGAAGAATSALATGKAANAAATSGYALARVSEATKGMRGAPAMREALVNSMQAASEAAQNAAKASGNVSGGIRAARLANTVNNTVSQVMGGKANVSHSGSISGAAGMLGVRDAYLIIEYPNQSLAKDYKHFVGYPSNMYAKLSELKGYTEVEQVIAKGVWGTDDELAELVEALKGGVYL